MDFRTCPACSSSVLEDDVEDCPFCGASMSGKPKPASKKKPSASAAPEKPSGKPTSDPKAKKRPVKKAAAAAESGADDDPFEVDTSALRRAIKVAPRPTKSRTHQIVCPMCETPGFIAPKDAGKDVHCCNKECMVPVYKAPKPEVVEEEPEPPKNNTLMYVSIAVAVLVLGGAGWFFTQSGEEIVGPGPNPDPNPVDPGPPTPHPNDDPTVEEVKLTAEQIRGRIMKAAEANLNRRNQESLWQLATMSAQNGNMEKAREYLDFHKQVASSRTEYQRVEPLVEMAWHQRAAGKTAEVKKLIDEAIAATKNLPPAIRDVVDVTTQLAVVLAAVDRVDEAEGLIQQHQESNVRGQLSALWTVALTSGTNDLERETGRPYHIAIPEPMRMAVVECLVIRGEQQAALKIVDGAKSVAGRESCMAAWSGRFAEKNPKKLAELDTLITSRKSSDREQCRMWSAVACDLFDAGHTSESNLAMEKAIAASGRLESAPGQVSVPSMKEIHGSRGKPNAGLDDPSPWRSAALAASDVAIVHMKHGKSAEAWSAYEKSLEFARSMAPAPGATQALVDDCEKRSSSVKARIDSVLSLSGNQQQLSIQFGRYRTQCQALDAEAKERLQLQTDILREAAWLGLTNEAWTAMQSAANESNADERDTFYQTSLPGWIDLLAFKAGQRELQKSIDEEYENKKLRPRAVDQTFVLTSKSIDAGEISDAQLKLEQLYEEVRNPRSKVSEDWTTMDSFELDWMALRLVSMALHRGSSTEAFEFIALQSDANLKQDGLQLISGLSIPAGKVNDLWKDMLDAKLKLNIELKKLESICLQRGFISGAIANPETPIGIVFPKPKKAFEFKFD